MTKKFYMLTDTPLLSVSDLCIRFGSQVAVNRLTFDVKKNEILGIVGESGSGKSLTALALMGLLPNSAEIKGQINYQGNELLRLSDAALRSIRGRHISMVFQEPMSALNPSMRCGEQLAEVLLQHGITTKKEVVGNVLDLFEKVKLPTPEEVYQKYPHQLSGGQQQRIMIAMALACSPGLLIADEPTTALDVTVQKEILNLLLQLQKANGMAMIFISHDLNLVAQIAHKVMVMRNGKMVEMGRADTIFKNAKNPYTNALIAARPSTSGGRKLFLPTVEDFMTQQPLPLEEAPEQREARHQKIYAQKPILEIVGIEKYYQTQSGYFKTPRSFKALDSVSLKLYEGETLGLVGESGCGKSTLGKVMLLLEKPERGHVLYKGKDIFSLSRKDLMDYRKDVQLIFQDPYATLNPRLKIGETLTEPMKVHGLYKTKAERIQKAESLLESVGLSPEFIDRFPHEFSGGQRQRIGLARALAVSPKIIVCDESVSALDTSVQAQVLNLLNELKKQYNLTYLFISHDLSVVRYMSDQLVVLKTGQIVEQGEADTVILNPAHQYTKTLWEAVPKEAYSN